MSQRERVLKLMLDGKWRTVWELSSAMGERISDAGLTARLRDLRKAEFGGWGVEWRYRRGTRRTAEYRVARPAPLAGQASLFQPIGHEGTKAQRV